MNDTLYLINGSWLTYEEAHNLGYTLQRPNILTFYSTDLVETPVIQDISNNTFYDSVNQQWVSDIDDLNLYKLVGDIMMFDGEIQHTFVAYSSSAFSDEASHVYISNSFASIEDLHDNGGFTFNQCVDYIVNEGERLVWYDPNTELYWDNRDGRKLWVDTPPVISKSELQDVFISTNDSQIYLLPQWEESSFPLRLRSYSFDSQESVLNRQNYLNVDLTLINSDISATYVELYPDTLNTNVILYIFPADGAYDYNNNYYPQGYSLFSGDSITVWIDSDEDVTFYKGTKSYIIGKTHDLNYSEIYWCEDEYRTFSDMLSLGYTITPSLELTAVNTSDELSITDIFTVLFNDTHGYYIDANWYSTVADLNAAGYYLVEKVSMTVYGDYSNLFDSGITRNSESFNTSYKGTYYSDEQKTSILTWDGHKWLCEFRAEFNQDITKYVNSLNSLPSTTTGSTGSTKYLVIPITVNGTPISQFNQASIGDTMYLYFATNYTSWISSSSAHLKFILYCWQYI